MIICDTREQKNDHILRYFEAHGIAYKVMKLDTGDYMDSDRMDITVDRKQSLDELAHNLCTKDDSRFWREIRRSREQHLKMIILCEHGRGVKDIEDVKRWTSAYSKITGRMLADRIYRAHIAYGIEFLFCNKRQTGKRILELLHGQS